MSLLSELHTADPLMKRKYIYIRTSKISSLREFHLQTDRFHSHCPLDENKNHI